MSDQLKSKTAFVTGGCGGIGAAICKRFAAEGASVIAADLQQNGTQPLGVEFREFDLTREAIVKATFNDLAAQWDRLDILVNAAGIEIEKTIEDTTLEEWNRIFAINVTGMFLTSKYALPLLRESGTASVINFGSYDGYIADPGLAAYCATKGAVHALTRAMACDHGPEGIRVKGHSRQCDLSRLRQHPFVPVTSTPRCCKGFSANRAISNHSNRRRGMYIRCAPMANPRTSPTWRTGSPRTRRATLRANFGCWTAV